MAAVPAPSMSHIAASDAYDKRRYEPRGVTRVHAYDPMKYANMADVAEAALDDEDAREHQHEQYTSRSDENVGYRPLPGNEPKTHEQWAYEKAQQQRHEQRLKHQRALRDMMKVAVVKRNGEQAYREWIQRKNRAAAAERDELRSKMNDLQTRLAAAAATSSTSSNNAPTVDDEKQKRIASLISSWRQLQRSWNEAEAQEAKQQEQARIDAELARVATTGRPLSRPIQQLETAEQKAEWKAKQEERYWRWRKKKDEQVIVARTEKKKVRDEERKKRADKREQAKAEYHKWMSKEERHSRPYHHAKVQSRKNTKTAKKEKEEKAKAKAERKEQAEQMAKDLLQRYSDNKKKSAKLAIALEKQAIADREAKWGRHVVPALAYGAPVADVANARHMFSSSSGSVNEIWASTHLPRSTSATFGPPLASSTSTRIRHQRRRASLPSTSSTKKTAASGDGEKTPAAETSESKRASSTKSSSGSSSERRRGSGSSGGNKARVYREGGPRELAQGADLNAQLMALMNARVASMTRTGATPYTSRTPRTQRGIAKMNDMQQQQQQQSSTSVGNVDSGDKESKAMASTNRLYSMSSSSSSMSAAHQTSHATSLALSRPRQRPASAKTSRDRNQSRSNKSSTSLQGKPYIHLDKHCPVRDTTTFMSESRSMYSPPP